MTTLTLVYYHNCVMKATPNQILFIKKKKPLVLLIIGNNMYRIAIVRIKNN